MSLRTLTPEPNAAAHPKRQPARRRWNPRRLLANAWRAWPLVAAAAVLDAISLGWLWRWGLWR
jgi:uncharacterized protein involved in exopolysaccharide biosynthesis